MEVPEVVQRACRIFVAVALSVGTGTAILFYFGANMDDTLCKQIRSATGGAAITCVVAQAPLIGNLARGGVENTIGTMLGGTLGFCVFLLAHILACSWHLPGDTLLLSEYLVRVAFAPFIGALGVFFGWRAGMDISGRLVLLTWILVCINNDDVEHAGLYAISRTSAIIVGVICSQIAMLTVFPASATTEAIRRVRAALGELLLLDQVVWGEVTASATAEEGADGAVLLGTYLASEGGLDRANYYGSINTALNIAAVHMQAAKYEAVVQMCGRPRCILPTWGCLRPGWVLPVDNLLRVSESIRRLTRLEYSLHQLLLGGGLGAILPGSTAWELAQTLARSSQGALLDLHAAFPKNPVAKSGSVQTFIKASKELTELPVPRLLASFASLPEHSIAPSPSTSRSNVLQRLPSLQGKEYTPEVVVFFSFQWFVGELAQELSNLHSAMTVLLAELHQ